MDMQKKKRLFLIGGVALAVLVAVILVVIVFGGSGGDYAKHYDAAQSAFLRRDYDTALRELEQAIKDKPTEDAYLLMASIYEAQGDTELAVSTLYLGYSKVGGSDITAMLNRLKGGAENGGASDGSVTVAGISFPKGTTSVVLSGKGLGNSDLAALCRLTELQNLSISNNAITDITPVSALTGLSTLQLSDNRVANLSPLSSLTNLKTLYLDGNPIRDLTPLYQLSGLRTLSMKGITFTGDELDALKEALPNCNVFSDAGTEKADEITLGGKTFSTDVKSLSLGGLGLTDISALRDCTELTTLDLRNNRIKDLSPLVDLLKLEDLCIWNNEVTDITPLMGLTKLRRLDAEDNKIQNITALEYLPELKELWLNGNPLRSLAPLGKIASLTRLGLKDTGLTDAKLESLYALTGLTELAIEDNPDLTMAGFEALSEALPKCGITHSELRWSVALGGKTYFSDATEIDAADSGVGDLGGFEHFTELRKLILDGNPLSDADLYPLYGLTKLRTLSLRGTGVPETELRKLREKLPDCEILSDDPEESPTPSGGPSSGGEGNEDETPPPADSALAVGMGESAAVNAAGTGSGYAILWQDDDAVSEGIREGFLSSAGKLGMNVVYDDSFAGGDTDFTGMLSRMKNAGADVVFVAAGDAVLSRLVAQKDALDYTPQIVQVYPE